MTRFGGIIARTALITVLLATPALCVESEWDVIWRWHAPEFEVYAPTFSPRADEVAFVRQVHWPDGHEAEAIPRKKLDEYDKRRESDKRFADPEIVLARVGEDKLEHVDWGWSPAFSPDGAYIAYAHQKKPISGLRVLAETLEGNEIRIYDRKARGTRTLAVPPSAYLSDPIFTPAGDRIIFSYSDAVNGAFGGNVGVGSVTIATKEIDVLYPPTKEHDLYHIVHSKRIVDGKVMALRMRPEGPGRFLADSYTHELLELGKPHRVVYSWRKHKVGQATTAFAVDSTGQLEIYDGTWRHLGDKNAAAEPSDSAGAEGPGFVSPNGEYVAHVRGNGITVSSRRATGEPYSWKAQGRVQDLVWSPDSKRIALVITTYADESRIMFLSDRLVVLERQ